MGVCWRFSARALLSVSEMPAFSSDTGKAGSPLPAFRCCGVQGVDPTTGFTLALPTRFLNPPGLCAQDGDNEQLQHPCCCWDGQSVCGSQPGDGWAHRENVTEPSPCISHRACSQGRPQTLSSSSCWMHKVLCRVLGLPAHPCATTHAHTEPGGKGSHTSVPT